MPRPFFLSQFWSVNHNPIKMKTFLLAILFTTLFSPVFAQFPTGGSAQPKALPGTAGDQTPKGNSKISGAIVDSAAAKGIEFASIALYNKKTGQAIDGTVADEKGKFSLTKIVAGDFKILISFIGYQNKTIDNITLSKGQELDLGTIKLTSNVKQLDEVTVTGQAALIEEKVDRLVYNAEKDIAAKGGDATDVLRKVPLLTLDLDGNVSLRGSQNIKVLINNKPSTIVASSVSDALKQIPADQIKTVEVITSPSAKYDAEGSGGIINIITKKNSLQGLNLNVDAGVGNRGSMLSLNGGYRKGKAGFTIGGFGRGIYNTMTKTTLDQTSKVDGVETLTNQTGDGSSKGLFGQYNLGFDYDLAKNQSITAGVRYGVRNMISQQDLITKLYKKRELTETSGRNVDAKNLSGTVDANIDYLHTFKPQQEWSISTLYSRNDLTNNFDADLLNVNKSVSGRERNENKNINQEFTLQTDYQTPIKKNQLLEFGGKGIFREVNSDYKYLMADATGDFVKEINQPSGELTYHQNIAAGYSSYTYTTKKRYTFKGGLRYEHTFIDASTREGGTIGVGNYGVLVPSVNASKTIKGATLKLGYNRRTQRPGLAQLNPNFNAANPQNITIGNPELRPELTNNFELGVSKNIKKVFVNATFFGRVTNNAISQVRTPSDSLPGAVVTTYQNIGRQHAYGTNLFANVAATSKINFGLFLNAFYTSLSGQGKANANGVAEELTNTGVNVSGGIFSQAQFKNGWGAQAFGFMQGTQVQLQGKQGGFGFYTVGVKKEFKNKKGSLGLAAENFLSKRYRMHTELNSEDFSQINNVYLYNRGVRLTFTYKIGKMTMDAPKRKAKSVNNDDVKSDGSGGQQQSGGTPGGGQPK
jgi:outer membrane receptor protein involved in Fe transport